MNKIKGSEAVIRCLISENIKDIFGYPGGAIMPIYDSIFDFNDKIRHILVRHEQNAAHAAQGYARVTNDVGVCMATSGPGATNLVTGIADAFADSSPIVCITGQVDSKLIGSNAFQETDVIGITTPITKWNYQITDAKEIPEIISKAFYIAKSGRPGPVLIDITKDAQFQEIDTFEYKKCNSINSYIPNIEPKQEDINKATYLINNAKKPLILFGQGVLISQADEELKNFINKTGIPAAWTILGLGALPTDYNLNVGMLGMHGNYAPNKLTNEADLIIAIGMRFDDRVTGDIKTYANNADIIHIEIDQSEINKNKNVTVGINSDAKSALKLLIEKVNTNKFDKWLSRFKELEKLEYNKVIKNDIAPQNGQIKMAEVVSTIAELTKGEAIITTDVGQHQMVGIRYSKFNSPYLNVTSGGLGTMGFGLPSAIGAKIAMPNKTVVSYSGDGGFQMSLPELATIFQEKLDIKVIILNNTFLGMVRQWQELFFDRRYSFVDMVNPDFVKIAEGFRLNSVRISDRKNLYPILKDVFSISETTVVEIMVEKEENVFPMVQSGTSVSDIRLE